MLDIYLVQMEVAPNDKAKNFAKVLSLTAQVRREKGNPVPGLIVLPEMFATGYLPLHPERAAENFSTKESGETAKFLYELASRTGCAVMGAGIASKGELSPSNIDRTSIKPLLNHSSVYLPDYSREFAHYDKRHPFFMEQGKFSAGARINLFKIEEWPIAATICFDLRFPELYRDAVKAGAKLVTVQAAWPAARIAHWKTLLQARAIENQVYVAAVNCTDSPQEPRGLGRGNIYNGCSMIIDPKGETIAQAGERECVLHARIESGAQVEYRKQFPVLRGIVKAGLI